ncbi:branched-chain amino acid ABC transporter permease [Halomarina pelagica]|uniref:branched-chain amino acid ABC transporter permease n=1 Tax=Halomarina pelagica TaxID=2961599 RepID=UPI0020C3C74F|nr:branched-chain amino acid ABC transporter permease [Halomarina sp. BND7]
MSAGSLGGLDALRERIGEIDRPVLDALMVLGMMLGLYAVFAVVGSVIGFNTTGIFRLLANLTLLTAVYALAVLALNLQWGYAGLFNIGVAGFLAVGAYSFGMLSGSPTGSPPGLGLPLWLGVLGAMLVTSLVGLATAFPALRLRADYLAIATLAISEVIRLTVLSRPASQFTVAGVTLGTGGGQGFRNWPENPIEALFDSPAGDAIMGVFEAVGVTTTPPVEGFVYALVVVLVVGVVYLLLSRTANSPFGRVLKAIREDELVASSLGKDTRAFKVKVFMLGCALMGLAGILWYVYGLNAVEPASFRPDITFYVFIALIIGGSGSNTGSVLGAGLFAGVLFLLPQYLDNLLGEVGFLRGISTPSTFADAVGPLASLDVGPLVGYTIAHVDQMRFVVVGVLLVYLMQRRPEGLLGHRIEPAAAVDLRRRPEGRGAATDGGASGGESDE